MSRALGQLVAGTGAMLSLLAPAQAQTGGGPSGEWKYSVVKAFESSPGAPKGRLHQGSDGALYGTTRLGGPRNGGTLFKVNPDGTGFTFLLKFGNTDNLGATPGVIQGVDGALYGTSSGNPGTVYRVNTDGTAYTVLKQFTSTAMGYDPESELIQGIDGALYGTTTGGGASGAGTVFKVNPDGTGFTTLVSFDNTNGASPYSGLIQGLDGALYGTTVSGATGGSGTAFKVNADGGLLTLVTFDGANGARPLAGLVQGPDGVLYGTTREGGSAYSAGTVFRVNPDGTGFATIVTFDNAYDGGVWGTWPQGDLVLGPDGALYGTTQSGGYQTINSTIQPARGTVFRVNTDGTGFSTILTFTDPTGAYPYAGLTLGADGALYGMTEAGGAAGQGTVFRLNRDGSGHTILASFNETGGSALYAGVIEGQDGYLYGTTYQGGSANQGTLFRVRRDGSGYAVLLSFQGATGVRPQAGLVQGLDGALYGTTSEDGSGYSAAGGTVFKINPDGTGFTVLHAFTASSAQYGWQPVSAVIQGSDGVLYGTTSRGGTSNYGTVFRLNADGSGFASLASFDWASGVQPQGALVQGTDGALYGTTNGGGTLGHGTVFRLNTDGNGFAPILNLDNGVTGGGPYGSLLEGSDGALYGTAYYPGTVFKVNPDGSEPALVAMLSPAAIAPYAGLIGGAGGALYGTTLGGGASNAGTVFTVNADGTGLAVLASFSEATGASPLSALVLGSDGSLYGTTFTGGPLSGGVVFRLTPPNPPAAQVAPASLDFGSQAIGSASAAQAVTVTNTGGETLSVTGATATGDFQATSGCTTSLGAGASCAIQVAFAPSALGVRTGTLTVTTTAGGPFAVGLTGTGASVPPPITIATPVAGVTWTVGGSQAITWTHGLGAAATFDLDISRDGGPWKRIATAVPAASATTGSYAWTVTPVATSDARIRVTSGTGASAVSDSFSIQLAAPLDLTYEVMAEFALPERYPIGALVQASDGNYYGASAYAGASNIGAIFRMTPSGVLTDLYSITSADGPTPYGGLTEGPDGALYGTTAGELTGPGSLFRITFAGAYTKLSTFPSGATPQGWLTLGPDGALYGTTKFGGANGQGSVYRATIAGVVTDAYSFTGGQDGGHPIAGLTLASDGSFYGTTIDGGQNGRGTVFRITPAGDFTRLHDFALLENRYAHGGLIEGADGNFYGTTVLGGPTGNGSVFRMTPSGAVTVLHHFTDADGVQPYGRLVQGDDGSFYGTAYLSGTSGVGTAFRITRDGVFTVVHPFAPATGGTPFAPLIRGNDGALYGMASVGGTLGGGVIYRLGPPNPAVAQVTPTALDFGALWVGATSAAQVVTLQNTGTGPLTIASILASGDFASTNDCPATLGAGASCSITVTFTPAATGTRSGAVTVTDDATGSPHVVSLLGQGTLPPAPGVSPSSVDFGSVRVGQPSATQTVTLTNTGGGELTLVSATTTPAAFGVDASGCTSGLVSGASCVLGVTFTPSTAGAATGSLSIQTNAGLAVVTLQGSGTQPVVSFSPTSLDFGSVDVGSTSTPQTVTLQNTGTAPLAIGAITATGDFARTTTCPLAPATLAVGDSCSIEVTLTPTAEGARAGTLSIADDAAGSPRTLSLDGTGVATAGTWEYTIVKAFSFDPSQPSARLTRGVDGALYGTTQAGGSGWGTVFKVNADGSGFTKLVDFDGANKGAFSSGGLMLGLDGMLYGTTEAGGAAAVGTLFKVNVDGSGFTTLVDFNGTEKGASPRAGLVQGADGTLYGTTLYGGASNLGVVFKVKADGSGFAKLLDFNGAERGAVPWGNLVLGVSGVLYGTTFSGGASSQGAVFMVNVDGSGFAKLVDFNGPEKGANPIAGLFQGADGALYGATQGGGSSGQGTAFKVNADGGSFAILVDFNGAEKGAYPLADLMLGADGALYGTTQGGGASGMGTAFKVNADGGGFTKLVDFDGAEKGAYPYAGLVQGADGALYGTTPNGGAADIGTVFKLNADGAGFAKVVDFKTADQGAYLQAGLLQGADGALYGSTSRGGASDQGTAFRVSTDGSGFTKLVDFNGSDKGAYPHAGLMQGVDGALYGTTREGGAFDQGTAFRVNADGSGFTKLVDFNGAEKGALPHAGLVQGSAGALYGTTASGGASNRGVVFKVNVDGGGFATLVDFNGSEKGASPEAGLVQGVDGALYGTARGGGAAGHGTVFKVNADGSAFTKLVDFDGAEKGSLPYAGLVQGMDGALYGTTFGNHSLGSDQDTVFKVSANGSAFTRLVDFEGTETGAYPYAGLVQGVDGALYGTTFYGGASGEGVVFKVNADGSGFTKLVDFDYATKGSYPQAGVVQGSDGALYGTTHRGGPGGGGVVFRVRRRGPATAQVAPNALALGSVNVGASSAPQVVTVTNTGSGTVNVTAATVVGDFQITNGCTAGLGSDANCTIQVAFQPTALGLRTGTLTVSTDAGGPFTVSLTGTGTAPAVALAPASLDFGSAEIGATTPAQPVALQNTGTGPLAIASIVGSGDFASTSDCPATLGAGASCSITVMFTPTAAGARSGAVTVTDDATGSPRVVSLSGQGTQPPAVAVAPSSLAFGAAVVGQTTSAQTVTVTNTGGGTLNVTGAAVSGDFLITNGCTAGIGAGASCGIEVRFAPSATGARPGVLTVTTNAGGPQAVVLSGTGTAPVAALTPASLAFGSLAVGVPSAPKTATLANTGDGPLTIASIVTTGDYAFASACPIAPATLPPGGTCTIAVTFTAAATGSRPGTLRVTDNASGSPRTVNLTGTGAVVSVSPTSLAFGSVPLQTTSAAKTVTVNNSTLGPLPISSIAITTLASDYAQTNNCPATLPSGATCVVTVTFKPTVAGSRAGQLRISYGASAVNVGLGGTGTFNLGVSPASLTFAKQALGTTSAAKTVTLTNGNGTVISISGITSVGEFPIQSNTCGTSLAAGTTCTFTVAFTPSAAGARTGQVSIADTATGNPHKVNLTGTGTIPLTVAPASLGFGSVIAGVTSAAKTVTLTNANPVAVSFASITASGDYSVTSSCAASLEPNTSCTLSVTFTPTATGSRPATLDILSDATSSPQKVNLTGTGTLPLNTSGNLSFGSVVAGVTSAAKTITLTNPSPLLPISLVSIVPTGDYAATDSCAGSIAPSGSCTVSVTFTPTATGTRSGSVVSTSNATNNPRTSTLTGSGTLPLTVSPTSLAFGNQAVNTTSAPKTVTLTNGSPLLAIPITNVTLTGTVPGDYAQTNDCGTSIAAGGSCTVTLTFRPTATGARAGQLTITSSGATTSPNRVNLSGRGI